MSRFYLTSSEKQAVQAGDICTRAGLPQSGEHSGSTHFVRSYSKRGNGGGNFCRVGSGKWICFVGTIVKDETFAEYRMEKIYEDYKRGGVKKVRKNMIGHYAMAVSEEGEVTIFTDPQGAFTLYYANLDADWFVSNSLQLTAACCSEHSADKIHLLATGIEANVPGPDTFYPHVKRLFGTQALRINLRKNRLMVDDLSGRPDWGLDGEPTSVSETASRYVKRVRTVFSQLDSAGSTGVMTTGGLDSRTVLAGLLDQGGTPLIINATGNSALTNTRSKDRVIAQRIAERFDLNFYPIDWSDDHPKSADRLARLFERYGFKYEIYGAPEQFLSNLEDEELWPDLILGGTPPHLRT